MICDSDVVIHALRGLRPAAEALAATSDRGISTVTRLEVLQGAADKRRQKLALRMLSALAFEEHALTPAIGSRAADLLHRHALGNGLRLADALIAATAVESGLPLFTGNVKHFSKIRELELVPFRA